VTDSVPSGADALPSGALRAIAAAAVQALLDRDPVEATYLGDHHRDTRLPDPSAEAAEQRAAELRAHLAALDALDPAATADPDAAVDAAVLRTALAAELLDLDEIGEGDWNPMRHNPGGGIHALVSRDFAPPAERLSALTARLAAVPEYLAAARRRLHDMSRIHLDTAVARLEGTIAMIDAEVPAEADPPLQSAAESARAALAGHRQWLLEQAGTATRDARLGPDRFHAKLALTLDSAVEPAALLRQAETDLARVTDRLMAEAARLAGGAPSMATVRRVLDELAADAPDDETVLELCRNALRSTTDFVRAQELVTVYDDPIAIVEMPEIDRGVAGAYCRENGPLEQAVLPTEFAVSPTPADWSAEQVRSFYREYNRHMLHELTVHEAMPGHALQLMHANRHRRRAATPVRAVWSSGSFIEGWAVYAEELMADHGYLADVSPRAAAAVRIQQLKMQLRSIINTILDIRFHCHDLDEAAAMELMTGRGLQEPGEAIGKWRRVQLTSTQLCTYYVGYTEVRDVVRDLRTARPSTTEREIHDAVLAHGSPPPRHLRTLLDLPAA
jgi:uncharacterized protein (DUF885 family)